MVYFHSTRGLKKGYPLSPTLFILGAEVLTRMLNHLHHNPLYKGFHMEPKGPQINHLSFADDVIILLSLIGSLYNLLWILWGSMNIHLNN